MKKSVYEAVNAGVCCPARQDSAISADVEASTPSSQTIELVTRGTKITQVVICCSFPIKDVSGSKACFKPDVNPVTEHNNRAASLCSPDQADPLAEATN